MSLADEKPNIVEVYVAIGGRSIVRPHLTGFQKVLCPLHEEREPSATINESVGRLNCFAGCTDGRAVDSYELVMRKEGLDFAEAQRRAWELAPSGDEVRRQPDGRDRRMAPRKRDRRANRSYVPPWNRGRP